MASIVSTLGAGSGIDTRTLIDQLVSAERTAKTTPLNTRATALDARISALAQVKASLAGIATSLDTRVKSGSLGLVPQSSNPAVATIARFGTGPTRPFLSSISVNTLAAPQSLTAPPLATGDAPVGKGSLTISFGTRTDLGAGAFSFAAGSAAPIDITIDDSNNSLVGLRDAINAADAGITATIVSNAGSATLALRGADGKQSAFIISAAADPADLPAASLSRFAYTPGAPTMALKTAAVDADLSIDGIAVTRATNTIDDLVAGTRITLVKADPAVATRISAARDGAALSTTLSDLADTLGAMRGLIGDLRKSATGTDPAGALANDATARTMDQRLVNLVSAPVAAANGLRLRDLGLNITRTGTVEFDATRFAALSPTRYADAEAVLKALAAPALSTQPNRLQSIAELATPASIGLTRQRTAITTDLGKVDSRLATYRTTLTRQYAAMDRLVAASNAVKEQLDQQIAQWSKRDN